MIEDTEEAPYKIDRMLTHLRNAGKFKKVKAIVFGEMGNCDSANIDLKEVLIDEFANDDFLIFLTQSFGYGKTNLPWRYGIRISYQ